MSSPSQEFTEAFRAFEKLVLDMNMQWQMYDDLFSKSEHYPIFNRAGVNVFVHFRKDLIDVIFLSISRFFDPAKTCGKDNLSIAKMLEFSEVDSARPDLEARVKALRPTWKSGIQKWRHWRLSHSDLGASISPGQLPEVSISEMRSLVRGISNLTEQINLSVFDANNNYTWGISHWVPKFMRILRQGLEVEDGRK